MARGITGQSIMTMTVNNLPLERKIKRQVGRNLPSLARKALNESMKDAQKNIGKAINRVYDRPTRWTQRATFIWYASTRNLTAGIYFKDEAPKGNPAGKYLKPTVRGTSRRHKGFERKLIGIGAMRPNEFALPAKGVRLNQYGNISRGMLQKILTQLGAERSDATQNATARSNKRAGTGSRRGRYFVPRRDSHLAPGVYEAKGSGRRSRIKPVLIFTTNKPDYRVMLPFKRIARKTVKARLPIHARRYAPHYIN